MTQERLIQKVSQFTVAGQEGGIILDANGNPYTSSNPLPVASVNSSGVAYVDDPYLTIAAGEQVATSRCSVVNKFGRNPDIDTLTIPEDIWDGGGLWVPPTAARLHNVVSTSAEDAGTLLSTGTAKAGSSTTALYDSAADFVTDGVAAGDTVVNDTNFDHATVLSVADLNTLVLETSYHAYDPYEGSVGFNAGDTYRIVTPAATGASVSHWFGLDANMLMQQEFVIMNGTTNVPTTKTYYRQYRGHIDGAASRSVTNVGDISSTAQVDGTVTAKILAGNGQTGMAIYSVPADKTAYMSHVYADLVQSKSAVARLTIRQTPIANVDGAGSRASHYFGLESGSGDYSLPFKPYKKFLSNTDIWLRCDSVSANDMDISGGFSLILVDNQ